MFRFNIPRKFTGENRILVIFTRKSFVYTAVGTAIAIGIIKVLTAFNHPALGLIFGGLIIVPFYAFGSFKFSKDLRENAGEDLDTVVFRRLRKKFNKKIYVSNWEE